MIDRVVTFRGHILAGVVGAGLLSQSAAVGQEIRVLFVPPRDVIVVQPHQKQIERAIADVGGPLRIIHNLSDAEVVIQFTDYRRTLGKKGELLRWWRGQVKLLVPADEAALPVAPLPERFIFFFSDEETGTDVARVVANLERMLTKALGREPPKRSAEVI